MLSTYLNLTRFFVLCYLNLHDNTWQIVFSCIQYCTHITSVLFCDLNNNYIIAMPSQSDVMALPI